MADRVRLDKDGKYPVLHLVTQSSQNEAKEPELRRHESMGTKAKVWVAMPAPDGSQYEDWLLKQAREGTGEHWSEKIAYEVGLLLGLPIAEIQLATWNEWPGLGATLSKGFKQQGQSLIHGNELLSWVDSTYPKENENYRTKEHTLSAVREALCSHGVEVDAHHKAAGLDAFGVFTGYLLLDALVCNTDRHHENWAVLATGSGSDRVLSLAPTYDHASSLGRELKDPKRELRLTTSDQRGNLRAYCDRAMSALFGQEGAARPLSCQEAYHAACGLDPGAAKYWKGVVGRLEAESLEEIPERIPANTMTPLARQFSAKLLTDRLEVLKDSKQ